MQILETLAATSWGSWRSGTSDADADGTDPPQVHTQTHIHIYTQTCIYTHLWIDDTLSHISNAISMIHVFLISLMPSFDSTSLQSNCLCHWREQLVEHRHMQVHSPVHMCTHTHSYIPLIGIVWTVCGFRGWSVVLRPGLLTTSFHSVLTHGLSLPARGDSIGRGQRLHNSIISKFHPVSDLVVI
jgi:hypothetical protein